MVSIKSHKHCPTQNNSLGICCHLIICNRGLQQCYVLEKWTNVHVHWSDVTGTDCIHKCSQEAWLYVWKSYAWLMLCTTLRWSNAEICDFYLWYLWVYIRQPGARKFKRNFTVINRTRRRFGIKKGTGFFVVCHTSLKMIVSSLLCYFPLW